MCIYVYMYVCIELETGEQMRTCRRLVCGIA
jgi:hypothetical protein